MNRDKPQTRVPSREKKKIAPSLPSWYTRFISLPVHLAQTSPRYKRTQGLGNFLENPLQFSSMLVKLQKKSQQGTWEHSYQSTAAILPVCLSTLLPRVIGIIVRLALGTNWSSSWRVRAVSLKGHVSGGAPGDTERASMLERQLAWWNGCLLSPLCIWKAYAFSMTDSTPHHHGICPDTPEQKLGEKQCITCIASS